MKPEIASAILILSIAAYIDWKEHRVPNWLTYTAWIMGLFYHGIFSGWAGLEMSFWGSMAGLATLVVPYALGGMGAGDVKLMAAVGAWVGASMTFHAFLWIAVAGGLMGLYSILRSPEARQRIVLVWTAGQNLVRLKRLDTGFSDQAPHRILLPYGVPIALGYFAYFIFGGLVG